MYTQYFLKYVYSYSSAKVKDTNITIRYILLSVSSFFWHLPVYHGLNCLTDCCGFWSKEREVQGQLTDFESGGVTTHYIQ